MLCLGQGPQKPAPPTAVQWEWAARVRGGGQGSGLTTQPWGSGHGLKPQPGR